MTQPSLTISPASVPDIRNMRLGSNGQAVSSWLPPVHCLMTTGTIYYDKTTDAPLERLQRMSRKYQRVYFKPPVAILVEIKFFESLSPAKIASLPYQVRTYRHVLPDHFWMIGQDEFIQRRSTEPNE